MGDLSMSEKQEAIRNALVGRLGGSTSLYIAEAWDDRVVYTTYSDGNPSKNYEVEYSITDAGDVTLGDEAKEVERRTVFQPVKFVDDDADTGVIEGLAIPFSSPLKGGLDLAGERFDPEVDLCLDWFPDGRPLLYHHGLNSAVKTAKVGRQVPSIDITDEGVWTKAELDKRGRYYSRIQKLVDDRAVSFSSGTMEHLASARKGVITRWPWVELSLTPTPANPGAMVYAVKADLRSFFPDDDGDSGPEPQPFDAHAERVATDLGDFVERAQARLETRSGTKAGREYSTSNREWLRSVLKRTDAVLELRREIQSVLERTDPDAKKALEELEADLVVTDLRIAGLID